MSKCKVFHLNSGINNAPSILEREISTWLELLGKGYVVSSVSSVRDMVIVVVNKV